MDHDLTYQNGKYAEEEAHEGPDWKKIVMFASFGFAAFMFIKGKRTAGFAAAGVGLAALASEHPEKMKELWERAPEYLEKGHRLVNTAQSLIDRVAEQSEAFQSLRRSFRPEGDYRSGNSR